jgi:hypothetical protein
MSKKLKNIADGIKETAKVAVAPERKANYSASMTGHGGLVERYVYDVCRRLSPAEREDVKTDLTASIFESLDGKKDEDSVQNVLESFGSPASLADKYRTNPRFLISPANYEMYNKTVTRMMVIVALIFAAVTFGEFLTGENFGFGGTVNGLGDVCFAAVRGMAYAFFFTTTIYKTIDEGFFSDTKKWSISDLPKYVPMKIAATPVDGAGDVARAVCILVTMLVGFIIPEFIHSAEDYSIFDRNFLLQALFVLLIFLIFTFYRAAVKLRFRDWCRQVRNAVIVTDTVYIVGLVYLFAHPLLFTVPDNDRPVTDKIQVFMVIITVLVLTWDIRKAINLTKENEQSDLPQEP